MPLILAASMLWFARAYSFATASNSASASLICSHSFRTTSDVDIFSRLLKDRNVFLYDTISITTASLLIAQLLFLESHNPSKPIQLFINSLGGSISAGMAIYDAMNYIHAPISTLCVGKASSMASFILTAGAPRERRAFPNSSIMIHQPSSKFSGQISDHYDHVHRMLKVRRRFYALYAKYTGQPIKVVKKYIDRATFFDPEEAEEFGLIDEIIDRRPSSDGGRK